MSTADTFLNDRYGPWALISGASDGLGACLARQAAARGLNCALVARRAEKLQHLARNLSEQTGVKTKTYPLDLMAPGAGERLVAIGAEIDIGLYIINAGGDTVTAPLIDADPAAVRALIGRNVNLLTQTVQFYAKQFAERGRGALAVIGSDSSFNGAGRISVYSGTKAYALNLIESLWAELRGTGVDATYFAIGSTDTPKLRSLMDRRGVASDAIDLARPDVLAKWVLNNLGSGPTQVFDVDPNSRDPLTSPVARRKRVERNTEIIDFFFGDLVPDEGVLKSLKSGRSWK